MQQNKEIDMCNGPLFKNILLFAFPLMLSGILQLLFNTTDLIVVGRFAGDDSLAAVGSTSTLINLSINLFIGLSVGSNVVAARYYGAKKEKEVSETVHTSIFLSLIFGIVVAILGVLFSKYFLIWMKTPANIIDKATLYLRIYFSGMPFIMLYNFGSSIMRVKGDTRRPLFYLLIGGLINVGLNLLFVIVFKLDVAGVAIGTIASNFVCSLLVMRHLQKETDCLKFEFKMLKFNKNKAWKIIGIGLPAGFQSVVFAFSNVIIQTSINQFGEDAIAGNTASSSIENFIYTSMNAFHHAAITFTSQNIGAGKCERIKKILLVCLGTVCIAFSLLAAIILPLANPLLHIFSKSSQVIDFGSTRLYIIVSFYFLCGIMEVFSGSIRGMSHSLTPMIISLIGACGLRLILIFTFFQIPRFHSLKVLYAFYPLSWLTTIILLMIAYFILKKKTILKYKNGAA